MDQKERKKIPNCRRELIFSQLQMGYKQTDIARNLGISYSTVRKIISRHRRSNFCETTQKPGRPKKLNSREERIILRKFRVDRKITSSEAVHTLMVAHKYVFS